MTCPANKVHVREEELSNENDFYSWIARETEINANSFGALPILTKANYLLVVGNLSAKKLEKDKEKVESVVLAALSDSDEWIRALAAEFYREIRDTIIKKTEETTAYLAPEENPTQNIRGYSYCLPLRSEINFVLKRRSKAAAQRANCLEKAAIAVRKQCHKTTVANLVNSGASAASSSYFGNLLAKDCSLSRMPTKSLEDIKLKTASSRRDSGIKVLELEETPQHLKIERKEQERKRKEAEKLAKEEQKKLKAKERKEKQINKTKSKQVKKEQKDIVSSMESNSTTQSNNPPEVVGSTENT
ncbi:Viral dihydrofolate reductase [Trichinella pseudospiralis]